MLYLLLGLLLSLLAALIFAPTVSSARGDQPTGTPACEAASSAAVAEPEETCAPPPAVADDDAPAAECEDATEPPETGVAVGKAASAVDELDDLDACPPPPPPAVVVAPPAAAPAPPPPLGVVASAPVLAPSQTGKQSACASRQHLTVFVEPPKAGKLKSVRVYVDDKLRRTVKGRALSAPIVLSGLPAGTFTVGIRALTTKHHVTSTTRVYYACRAASK
ncbi:MAG: hypothetical protein NVSMB51_12210 [Solirubrobacteraceae bacterium]